MFTDLLLWVILCLVWAFFVVGSLVLCSMGVWWAGIPFAIIGILIVLAVFYD